MMYTHRKHGRMNADGMLFNLFGEVLLGCEM